MFPFGRQLLAFAAMTLPSFAHAQTELFTRETPSATAVVRIVGFDGEPSWFKERFGKTRSGSDGNFRGRGEDRASCRR